jgi:heterodisulfide reductase subunit C
MFQLVQIVIFILVNIGVFYFGGKKFYNIYKNINLGRDVKIEGNTGQRVKNVLLIAFGQKKMFAELGPAILHLVVYLAFLVTQVELIEIFIDGFSGGHRVIYHAVEGSGFLTGIYIFVVNSIEILSVFALLATFAFLARRNLIKMPRFVRSEMKGWPKLDGNIILYAEIYLVTCIFMMNGGDQALHNNEYPFLISAFLGKTVFAGFSESALHVIERVGWWGHILGVLAFIVYLPYSKHLHIMLAFPNVFFSSLVPNGSMKNMPEVTAEIKLMMNPETAYASPEAGVEAEIPTFGAKDVMDLTWKNLLDAYSCTECGRCTDQCPASQTGKKLSPRKVMMDTRDRLEEVALNIRTNGIFVDDGKSLISDEYVSVEELRACTTCNACVEACPITITPLDIIMQLRRNLVLEQSSSPEEWNGMFSNIENNGAPWKFSPQDRLNWADD